MPAATPEVAVNVFAHPLQLYAANAQALLGLPVTLDPSHSSVDIKVQRASLPDLPNEDVVKCRVELSLDGGLTWSPTPNGEKVWPWRGAPGEFTLTGSQSVDQSGAIAAYSSVSCGVAPGPNRMLRVLMTPLKVVTTAVEVALK